MTLAILQRSLPSWSFERSTYETLRMFGCIDVPMLSHMRLVRALARGYIRVIMYLGMYKAALRRKRRNMHVCRWYIYIYMMVYIYDGIYI